MLPCLVNCFNDFETLRSFYDAVVARYSFLATAALNRLMLPYLFPDLAAFATVADLITHLRTSDARYRAALPTEFCAKNPPPPLGGATPAGASGARVVEGTVGAAVEAVEEAEGVEVEVAVVAGVEVSVAAVGVVEAAAAAVEEAAVVVEVAAAVVLIEVQPRSVEALVWYAGRGRSGGVGPCTYVLRTGGHRGETCGLPHTSHRCFGRLTDAWRAQFPDAVELPRWGDLLKQTVAIFHLDFDAILAAMYALTDSAEGDCYLSVPPDPGIVATALGACASAAPGTGESAAPGAGEFALSGTAPTEALHTFILDSVLANSSTVLPCPAAPSGLLSGLHLPLFSANLVSGADLQDAWVAASGQLFSAASRSSPVSTPCSCRPLAHETLLWHHCLVHPSLPRLRGMASLTLVSGLPRSLPPLPPGHAPTCVPCVEGRQRAAPHSSEFPPTEAPLQTLHMDVWSPARIRGQGHERYFLLVVDDYSRYTTVFPLRSKDRGGEFSSDLLRAFCRAEGICQTFTLPASPQQNGIAERCIGMVMDVAHQPSASCLLAEDHTYFAVDGKVGDASMFRVWGSRAFVRNTSADKLSSRAVPCVFLGFPPDAPGWQFYHPTSRRVLSSQDVTFDESVSYYHLFPYLTASLPPPPLFLAPGTPPIDPLPPQGPAPSGVSQVDPVEHVEVAVDSGAARGAEPAGAGTGGVGPRVAMSKGAEPGGAEPERVEPGGAEPGGAESGSGEPGGAEPERAESGGPPGVTSRREPLSPHQLREWYTLRCHRAAGAGASEGASGAAGGATEVGAAGGAARAGAAGGTTGAGAAGAAGPGGTGAGGTSAVGAARGAGAAGPGGARTGGTGAAGAGGASGVGAAGDGVVGVTGAGGAAGVELETLELRVRVLSPLPPPVQSQSHFEPASPLPGPSPFSGPTRGLMERRELDSRPPSPESRSELPVRAVRTGRRVPRQRPPFVPSTHSMTLRPSTAPQRVPLPSPLASSLPDGPDPESDSLRAASPTVTRFPATTVTDPLFESTVASALVVELVDFAAACRLDYATSLVAESPSASVWPPSVEGTYVEEVPPPGANIVSGMWIFRVKQPPGSRPVFKVRYDARGFSQRQGVDFFHTFSPSPKMTTLRVLLHVAAQRDYELHSLDFSTAFLQGSLHEEIWLRRPPGFTGSFPAGTQWSLRRPVYGLRQAPREWHDTLRTTLAALGFAPSTADASLFLRTDTTLPPFYVLVYVDDLVFATTDTEALAHMKSELQKRHTCTDLGELTSYLGLWITRDRAQRTITLTQSHMVQQVLQRFGFTYSSPQSTPLSTGHSLSAPPSDESVELSGPYPELVGCLMYLMTCTRPGLAYPLSLLARYVAPIRHQKVHWDAAKSVLRYLCRTLGMGLVLGGQARVVLTGHADASWVDDLATQRSSQGYTFSLGSGSISWRSSRSSSVLSSSCEAEIYAGAMAA
ncbi:unnamed protein product [Closterium sp. NIES-53]